MYYNGVYFMVVSLKEKFRRKEQILNFRSWMAASRYLCPLCKYYCCDGHHWRGRKLTLCLHFMLMCCSYAMITKKCTNMAECVDCVWVSYNPPWHGGDGTCVISCLPGYLVVVSGTVGGRMVTGTITRAYDYAGLTDATA